MPRHSPDLSRLWASVRAFLVTVKPPTPRRLAAMVHAGHVSPPPSPWLSGDQLTEYRLACRLTVPEWAYVLGVPNHLVTLWESTPGGYVLAVSAPVFAELVERIEPLTRDL